MSVLPHRNARENPTQSRFHDSTWPFQDNFYRATECNINLFTQYSVKHDRQKQNNIYRKSTYSKIQRMQRTVLRRPFCPSVCPSVWKTRALWQNARNFYPHTYTSWKNVYPSFPTRNVFGRGRPLVHEILGQTDPVEQKSADRKSTTRFPMSL